MFRFGFLMAPILHSHLRRNQCLLISDIFLSIRSLEMRIENLNKKLKKSEPIVNFRSQNFEF